MPWVQFGGGYWGRFPNTFSDWGDIICHVPPTFFLFRFCKGFKNKSDVLCEELFMLNGRQHIAKLMLKQSLVWYL